MQCCIFFVSCSSLSNAPSVAYFWRSKREESYGTKPTDYSPIEVWSIFKESCNHFPSASRAKCARLKRCIAAVQTLISHRYKRWAVHSAKHRHFIEQMRCSTGANGFVACWMFANERLVRDGGKLSKNKRKKQAAWETESESVEQHGALLLLCTTFYPSLSFNQNVSWGQMGKDRDERTFANVRLPESRGSYRQLANSSL